jgi:lysophospholipase L1-like esterase
MRNLFIIFFLGYLSVNYLFAQQIRFENEILNFEKQDAQKMPKANANLFVGSSSIRLWQNLDIDFEKYSVINRGFGGSTLADLEPIVDRIIIKYNPANIFIYSGENDIADGASAQETLERFQKVFIKIRKAMPIVPVVFISIKPSESRIAQLATQKEANLLIKKYLAKDKNAYFANIVPKMMQKKRPNPALFIADKLHMNQRGYEIWAKTLKKYLVK